MDTIVTTLCPGDIFLIETPTGTKHISAVDVNFLSEKFEKFFNNINVTNLVTSRTNVSVLSASKFRLLNGIVPSTSTGIFTNYNFSNGVVTSATNTYDTQTAGLSSAANLALSGLSANAYKVFFESGSAVLNSCLWIPGIGAGSTQNIVGTKTVPTGLTIQAQDIQFKLLFNSAIAQNIGATTFFQITTAFPIAYIRDNDYNLDEFDRTYTKNNYVSAGKIYFTVDIVNNILAPPTGRVVLSWSVNKFY